MRTYIYIYIYIYTYIDVHNILQWRKSLAARGSPSAQAPKKYGQSTFVARTVDSRGVVAVRKGDRGRVDPTFLWHVRVSESTNKPLNRLKRSEYSHTSA